MGISLLIALLLIGFVSFSAIGERRGSKSFFVFWFCVAATFALLALLGGGMLLISVLEDSRSSGPNPAALGGTAEIISVALLTIALVGCGFFGAFARGPRPAVVLVCTATGYTMLLVTTLALAPRFFNR